MAYDAPQPGSLKRKRRRRRREDKPAISARLYLDSGLKGEVGVLSADLSSDLFPATETEISSSSENAQTLHAALTPWTPRPSPTDNPWTILPFRRLLKDERQLPPSTIRFPAGAAGTQSFVNLVQTLSPNRTLRVNAAIEVRVSDVVPLPLDTVFVSLDTDALEKFEDVQKRYGGGFMGANGNAGGGGGGGVRKLALKRSMSSGNGSGSGSPVAEDETEMRRKRLVLSALRLSSVLHTGDAVPLPLTHPITHAPGPPAKVLACEPVSQGLLVAETKIVLVPAGDKKKEQRYAGRQLLSPRLPEETEEDEDSALETFYSATEENSPKKPVVTSKSATDMSNTDDMFDSSAEESNLSDDPDDMISLARPGLTDQPSGLSSALTSATPRPFGNRTGVSTPGSVFSNVTSTTIRGGQSTRSKVFRAQGLLSRISDELLHPKPSTEEDEEARVYVDAQSLARLGCFSGDWARIEASENHILPSLSAFAGFGDASTPSWRPVKVYSLPESMTKRPPRYQVNPRHGRRDSISSLVTNSAAVATMYLSPILLANLDNPENVSLSPLSLSKRTSLKRSATARPGSTTSRLPPTASEVTLRKIVSPLSSERALNHALFSNLKEHFEYKQRIVKAGDLIAIPIDESMGRSIYEGDVEKESGSSSSELLSRWSVRDEGKASATSTSVAWFLIETVTATPSAEDNELADGADVWGDAVSIDPTKMTMRQSGDDRRRLPPTKSNAWPYYLGVKSNAIKAPSSTNPPGGIPETPQPYISQLQRRLRELISVSTSPRAVHLGLPPLALLLTSTQRSIGKAYAVEQVCRDLGMHFFPIDAYDITSESGSGFDTQAQGLLEARCERALDCGAENTAICIRHIDTLNSDRVAASLKTVLESARVLVATTTDVDKIPESVRGLFTHELEMSAPDESEREGILQNIINELGVPIATDVDLASIAVKTAALVAGDLVDVVDRAAIARTTRLETLASSFSDNEHAAQQATITIKDIALSGGSSATAILPTDFETAVDFARKNFADSIGAPKIPNVSWSDVGGLTHVKDAVIETIQLPLSRPELFAKGLKKRSGILFYGPPGTGKTLLAKAIATEFSLNFFSVKGPELLNMYIGESEANVRRVFQRARDARPCVVFFDELDSVAPKRGNQGDSGGVMDRIVSQLLAELDGMSDGEESGGGVFVIGATNRPDLLDQALLRPGRFDKMLYLGISDTHEKQATILRALTRKFTLDPDLSLDRVASTLPFTYTGADLYALCSDSMLKAVTRAARQVDERLAALNASRSQQQQQQQQQQPSQSQPQQQKLTVANYFDHYAQPSDLHVQVSEQDFVAASRELVPSVSLDELAHYERVRSTFEGSTTKKTKDEEEGKGRPRSTAPPPLRIAGNQTGINHSASSTSRPPSSAGPPSAGAGPGADRRPMSRQSSARDNNSPMSPMSPSSGMNGMRRFPLISTTSGPGAGSMDGHFSDADEDGDLVVRTERLSMALQNHQQQQQHRQSGSVSSIGDFGVSRPMSSKGKGKGKEVIDGSAGANRLDEGEDLYD